MLRFICTCFSANAPAFVLFSVHFKYGFEMLIQHMHIFTSNKNPLNADLIYYAKLLWKFK